MDNKILQYLSARGEETLIEVYVQPKAARNGLAGIFQDRLKVRVCAPPVEGEANKQVMSFLAELIGVSKSEVSLVRGGQSRQKTLLVKRPIETVREKLLKALG